MKKVLALLVTIALCVVAYSTLTVQGKGESGKDKPKFRKVEKGIPNEYIVVLKDDTDKSRIESIADGLVRNHGGQPRFIYKTALKGFSIQIPERAAEALSHDPRVEYVIENSEVTGDTTQFNPPSWGLDRIDQRDLPLDNAYTYNSTGAGVNVYLLDSGILPSHEEFGLRASADFDTIDDDHNPATDSNTDNGGLDGIDCHGHGTFDAGILGGTNYGVAKGVRIHAVRVLDCNKSGFVDGAIAGIEWVNANRVLPAVVNMSLSGGVSEPFDTAVRNSIASGITYVVAAGNTIPEAVDASLRSPARVSEALTVGAMNILERKLSTSNFGSLVDVLAPGGDITSAWIGSDTATSTLSGTSAAAPHVAGVVALYLEGHPGLKPATLHSIITTFATVGKITNLDPDSPNRLLYSTTLNLIDVQRFFVEQHYRDFLEREADTPGLDYWTSQITPCGTNTTCLDQKRVDVSRAFWYAPEFHQLHPGLRNPPGVAPDFENREFVRLCYLVYLEREPDQLGWDFWTNELNNDIANGVGYDHLIAAFLFSPEYRARFGG